MALDELGLSREVTGGKPIESIKQGDGELGRIIAQLYGKSHYVDTPEKAVDIIFHLLDEITYREDKDFIYGLLYILGEYVRKSGEYNINGIDGKGLTPDGVNEVRNRVGFISGQVFEILRNNEKHPNNPNGSISNIDFKTLSNAITKFLVSDASTEQRTKIQAIRDIIRENLEIESLDWSIILQDIQRMFEGEKQQKAA